MFSARKCGGSSGEAIRGKQCPVEKLAVESEAAQHYRITKHPAHEGRSCALVKTTDAFFADCLEEAF